MIFRPSPVIDLQIGKSFSSRLIVSLEIRELYYITNNQKKWIKNFAIIIEARTNSSRLPYKVIKKLMVWVF